MTDNRSLKCVKISLKALVKLTKLAGDESINEYCPRCFTQIRRHLRAEQVRGEWSARERAIIFP